MLLSQTVIAKGSGNAECRLRRDTASFLFALGVTVFAVFIGYASFPFLLPQGSVVSLIPTELYAGCKTAADCILRLAFLCRPILIQTVAIWISAYVQFEKALSGFVFLVRGVSLGIGLRVLFCTPPNAAYAVCTVAYMLVTAVLLLLTRCVHERNGTRSADETFICTLIAAGAASSIFIAVSILYYIDF